MKAINGFLNLFHQKHRFSPQYKTMSFLKKTMFFGVTGFVFSLALSKFYQTDLIYSFESTQENKLAIKLNPSLQRSAYYPSLPLIFGIFQNLYAKYRQQQPYMKVEQQQFEEQTLHWVYLHDKATHRDKKNTKQIPLIIVIAGSEGLDNTAKQLMLTGYNLGFRTIAIDPKDLYDKAKIYRIINHLKKKYPNSNLFGVGVQYGANLLLNVAAQYPGSFKAIVSVGNPYDLIKSQIGLQKSWAWKPLYWSILKGKLQKGKYINKSLNQKATVSLFQADKEIYKIADDQYIEWKQKNSNQIACSFAAIQRGPFHTVIFLQKRQVDKDQRFENQRFIYVTTQRGGHNEWFQNIWMNRWFVTPIRYFLKINQDDKIAQILSKAKDKKQQ